MSHSNNNNNNNKNSNQNQGGFSWKQWTEKVIDVLDPSPDPVLQQQQRSKKQSQPPKKTTVPPRAVTPPPPSAGMPPKQPTPSTASTTPQSLPPPPTGQEWQQDKNSREWKLVTSSKKTGSSSSSSHASPTSSNSSSAKHNNNHTVSPTTSNSIGSPKKVVLLDHVPTMTHALRNNTAVLNNKTPSLTSASLANGSIANDSAGADWDLLSDKFSHGSSSKSGAIWVARGGGSCTGSNTKPVLLTSGLIADYATIHHNNNNSKKKELDDTGVVVSRTPSFKLQRTHSNSTIDSHEQDVVGPSGQGVLGVDYVEHVILPTDTLQGICLAYRVHAKQLRQANHFSGNTLLLAPKKLVIPISKKASGQYWRVQDTDAKEYKLYNLMAEYPDLGMTEAKAYLELSSWDLATAKQSAQEDLDWEQEMDLETSGDDGEPLASQQRSKNKSGQIRITTGSRNSGAGLFTMQGAGIPSLNGKSSKRTTTKNDKQQDSQASSKTTQPIVYAPIPAIATKSVQPKDVYQAAPQHDHYGVELKDIVSSSPKAAGSVRPSLP